jgi:hypothetical protein
MQIRCPAERSIISDGNYLNYRRAPRWEEKPECQKITLDSQFFEIYEQAICRDCIGGGMKKWGFRLSVLCELVRIILSNPGGF